MTIDSERCVLVPMRPEEAIQYLGKSESIAPRYEQKPVDLHDNPRYSVLKNMYESSDVDRRIMKLLVAEDNSLLPPERSEISKTRMLTTQEFAKKTGYCVDTIRAYAHGGAFQDAIKVPARNRKGVSFLIPEKYIQKFDEIVTRNRLENLNRRNTAHLREKSVDFPCAMQ